MPDRHVAELLAQAAAGTPPPADGALEVLKPTRPDDAGVLGFFAHHVVVADVDPGWVRAQPGADDLSERFCPPFLGALSVKLGRRVNAIDAVLVGAPELYERDSSDVTAVAAGLQLAEITDREHPRVARALRYRDDVRVWRTTEPGTDGLVLLGRGFADRIETAVEVDPWARGRGLGRALFAAARRLVGPYATALGLPLQPVWAQVTPANVPSMRALIAAGYQPVGEEALLVR